MTRDEACNLINHHRRATGHPEVPAPVFADMIDKRIFAELERIEALAQHGEDPFADGEGDPEMIDLTPDTKAIFEIFYERLDGQVEDLIVSMRGRSDIAAAVRDVLHSVNMLTLCTTDGGHIEKLRNKTAEIFGLLNALTR